MQTVGDFLPIEAKLHTTLDAQTIKVGEERIIWEKKRGPLKAGRH